MAKRPAYKQEKRKKELNRLKKQEEKRQKRLSKIASGGAEGDISETGEADTLPAEQAESTSEAQKPS